MMKNSGKPIYRVILIFCIVVFLGCVGYLINLYKQPAMAEKEIEDLSESISETITENGYNENAYPENCVAWLEIKDTKINYPVMQKEDSPEYYLRKNYKGEYSYSGTPFLDADCKLGESQNLIVYGHNMKDGTMFSTLSKYKSREFYQKHPTINLIVECDVWEYDIVSVNIVKDTDEWYYFKDYGDKDKTNNLISQTMKKSLYSTGNTADYSDSFLTLSTCDYSSDNARLIIIAKRSE